jgi:hypothetical protein
MGLQTNIYIDKNKANFLNRLEFIYKQKINYTYIKINNNKYRERDFKDWGFGGEALGTRL